MGVAANAASALEGFAPHEWVAFERALVVRDIFTGGVRTFLSTADAQAFRSLIYKQYSEFLGEKHVPTWLCHFGSAGCA